MTPFLWLKPLTNKVVFWGHGNTKYGVTTVGSPYSRVGDQIFPYVNHEHLRGALSISRQYFQYFLKELRKTEDKKEALIKKENPKKKIYFSSFKK